MKNGGKNKIVFFGTSSFAVPALEALFNSGYETSAVITAPDEPAGRNQVLTPPPVKDAAVRFHLKIAQPQKLDSDFLKLLDTVDQKRKTGLGIVASYGKIIPRSIIDWFPLGIINIHPSLLPKYRGPSPIQTQLLNGETQTGITIIKIDEQVDHGPIIANLKLKNSKLKFSDLHDKLAFLGAELLIKILPDYISGKIEPVQQDHSKATFTRMITKTDGKINWNRSAGMIFNQFRALHLWPGIWTLWRGGIIKITDCMPALSDLPPSKLMPGTVYESNGRQFVFCGGDGIEILRLQPAGGKEMDCRSFIAGHGDFIGSVLG